MKLQISQVKVGERQREDYGEIKELAESLADPRFGQLQPIRIDRDRNLVAGGRRLAAAALLASAGQPIHGLEPGEIWAEYIDTLSPDHAQAIELEENVRRKDLTWDEQQKAISKVHEYKMKSEEGWSADKSAELLGVSKRTVYNALELSKAIEKHPDIAKADTAQGAMMRLTRLKDLAKREDDIKVAALAAEVGMKPTVTAEILCMDALEGMKELDSESQDGVIFNPPFGVDIEGLFTSGRHIYEDNADNMTWLTEQIVAEAYRVLKPDRWMVMFYPTARLEDVKGVGRPMWDRIANTVAKYLPREIVEKAMDEVEEACMGMLRRQGFTFQQVPAVWHKPNKRVSAMGDPYAQINITYENFYFARKGKAQLRKIPPGNVLICDTPETAVRIHPLEMPVEIWTTILEAICVGGEKVVEPFAGSGSGGEAAINLGINYKGWELDNEFALHAQVRLVGALNTKLAPTPKASKVPEKLGPQGQMVIDVNAFDSSLFGKKE